MSNNKKEDILNAGARLGAKVGIINVQRKDVADRAKCAPSLVSAYMGDTAKARAAYRKRMKALGLVEPSKDKINAAGIALRKHKPRTKPYSAKEVKAIKQKARVVRQSSVDGQFVSPEFVEANKDTTMTRKIKRETKPAPAKRETKPAPATTAARAPKAPPPGTVQ